MAAGGGPVVLAVYSRRAARQIPDESVRLAATASLGQCLSLSAGEHQTHVHLLALPCWRRPSFVSVIPGRQLPPRERPHAERSWLARSTFTCSLYFIAYL